MLVKLNDKFIQERTDLVDTRDMLADALTKGKREQKRDP